MASKKKAYPGKGQFPTTAQDEERVTEWLERKKRAGLDLSRAQAFALLVRRGLDAEEEVRA